MLTKIMALLFIYQIKHFLADYPMQTPYMMGKFKDKGWVLPLSAHCGVHALLTFTIALVFTLSIPIAVGLAAFDFAIHFVMDRIKASPKLLGRYQAISKDDYKKLSRIVEEYKDSKHPKLVCEMAERQLAKKLHSNKYFWWSLGFDQLVHHVTHYIIIFIIVGLV